MSSEIQAFMFQNDEVRIFADEHGEPWFVANDVAKVLGYKQPDGAVRDHCKAVQISRLNQPENQRGNPNVAIIPERDVYRLIMRSRLPEAERFEEWVVGEVLPSIDKPGDYIKGQKEEENPEILKEKAMSSEIQAFKFQGSEVRAFADEHGNPWFVAKDVAEVLGYLKPRNAISRHCKAARSSALERGRTSGGNPNVTVIPQRAVYRLIMRSNLPEAERFEEWVVGEVLPSIRKHGGYIKGQEEEEDPDALMARALEVAKSKLEEKKQLAEKQRKKLEENLSLDAYRSFYLQM